VAIATPKPARSANLSLTKETVNQTDICQHKT
jgi:hypothetical protein